MLQPGGRNRTRARGRKAAKRATFPFINSQIIAVAETGDVDLLVSTIEGYMPEMNLVNLSTAMHRLAKLTSSHPDLQTALQRHPVVTGLLAAARGALSRTEVGCAPPQCQALSNITWSLATLQCVDLELLQTAARLSHRHVACFKPFELSAALWAFAKLDSLDPAACQCAGPLFQAAAEYIPVNVEQFTFRCLVMTAWAFATARQHDERLFRGITPQMLTMIHTAQCQELANAAWAFSTANVREDRLFAELSRKALRQLGEFKPQELSNMIWAFAAIGFFREDFFVVAAQTAQSMDLQAQQLANVLWALSRIRPRHRATASAVLALLPRCTRAIETFKPQELSSVALAAAKCFGKSGGEQQDAAAPGEQQAAGGAAASAAMPPQVVEFFTTALPWVAPRLRYFSGQSLANIATSFLAVNVGSGSDLHVAVAREVFLRAQTLESSALLLLLRNLPAAPRSACGAAVCRLFGEAARRLESLPAKELQVLSRICASLLALPRGPQLSKGELASVCHALSKEDAWAASEAGNFAQNGGVVFENSAPLQQAFEGAQLQQVTSASGGAGAAGEQHFGGAKALGGLAGLAAAAGAPAARSAGADAGGAAGGPGGASEQPCSSQGGSEAGSETVLGSRVSYSVKNTFVDFSGEDDECESPVATKPLPPPLDIIPRSVPPQKLEAYRVNYQKFRAGDAVGAKGELSTVMALDLATDGSHAPGSDGALGCGLDAAEGRRGLTLKPIGRREGHLGVSEYPRSAAHRWQPESSSEASPAAASASPPATPASIRSSGAQGGGAKEATRPAAGGAAAAGKAAKKATISEEDLPPPLDFMPRFIDLDKLATFRMQYQQFRAGNAVGAKGEISKKTVPTATSPGPQAKPAVARLPPPLDIIPESVSPRKLAAYRESYQKFRAGDASGAKGEVSDAVALDDSPMHAPEPAPLVLSVPAALAGLAAGGGASSSSAAAPPPAHQEGGGCSSTCASEESSSPQAAPRAVEVPPAVAFSVKNTFVHVSDDPAGEEEAVAAKPLPPSLGIIPDSVPAAVLDAYRSDYQKFRAGCASGAKGEVSTLSALNMSDPPHGS